MAKEKLSADEKFTKQDFDLFEALTAIDKKDYSYFDKLTPEQQRKFVPFMLIHWVSAIKGNKDLQSYYLQSTDYHANKYLFNENVQKHPKLQSTRSPVTVILQQSVPFLLTTSAKRCILHLSSPK